MHYVYALKSKINGDLYIGCTEDLRNRYALHNEGKIRSTHAYKPWVLVYYEAYGSKVDATMREVELKIHATKNKLKEQIRNSLET